MKSLFVAIAMCVVAATAQAAVVENQLATCYGVLTDEGEEYRVGPQMTEEEMLKSGVGYLPVCWLKKGSKVSRQVLRVCKVGGDCTVSVQGEGHNRGQFVVDKILGVQRRS